MKTKILIFLYFFIFQNWTSANDQNEKVDQTFLIKNFCIFATIPGTKPRQQNGETKFRVKKFRNFGNFFIYFLHTQTCHTKVHTKKKYFRNISNTEKRKKITKSCIEFLHQKAPVGHICDVV
jgi:hypothetical protein